MAGDESSPYQLTFGKHRRSPDRDVEDEDGDYQASSPKRRRHHRSHRHRSHRHRSSSRHHRDSDKEVVVEELEEGEIPEEGEVVGLGTAAELDPAAAPEHSFGDMDKNVTNKDGSLVSSEHSTHNDKSEVIFSSDLEDGQLDEVRLRRSKSPRPKRGGERRSDDADLGGSEEKVLNCDRRSAYPGRSQETSRAPPYSRRHGETHHRDRSRSRDHKRELDARGNGLRSSVRDDSDVECDNEHGKSERLSIRRREIETQSYRERENSHTSRDRHRHRHDSRERCGDEKHYRDNSVGRERADEVDHKERERSRSHSRPDKRDSNHHSREWDRERERRNGSSRDKDGERRRDTSMDEYKARERVDSGHESEKRSNDRDRDRKEDKEMDLRSDREHRRQNRRDRVRSSDSNSKYGLLDSHLDRSRSSDKGREAGSRSQRYEEVKDNPVREENEEDYRVKVEQQLAKQEEEDPDKIKEEARRRREAILEKYRQKQQQQQLESSANSNNNEEAGLTGVDAFKELKAVSSKSSASHEEVENKQNSMDETAGDPAFTVGMSPAQSDTADARVTINKRITGASGLGEGTPESEADMFCDDIFGESPTGVRKMGKEDGLQMERSGLRDNWDDAEGYYSYRFGEVLDGRYEIIAAHGKGVFSTVVRAKDLKAGRSDPEEVAIKMIRNNETLYKAGLAEVVILKKLSGADLEDKRHCVRYMRNFMYRNHLCLVFESLNMNLREVLKKFGRNIGLKLTAVRTYSKQLFIALKHLRNCGVLHCDIKPDNMLVNEAKTVLKLCDFGSAMFAGKNEITPYLVSRFYRAPEIILGLPYDHPLDMWSVGCCIYELHTGKVLFPGPTNNDMLRLQMELKGPFPKKMLRKGAFIDQHFDQDLNFHATEEDPVTKKTVKRLLLNIKPKDIGALIPSSPGEDPKMLTNFKDLLERIFVLDPEKRITVAQALSHPFITGK